MSEVPVFDQPRVQGDEPGFEVRGQKIRFRPTGSPDLYSAIWEAGTDAETLDAIDAFVAPLLDKKNAALWKSLRAPSAQVPLWYDELFAICRHIASVTAARPTMPSNGSSPTPPASGTGSTADSSSPVAVPSAA